MAVDAGAQLQCRFSQRHRIEQRRPRSILAGEPDAAGFGDQLDLLSRDTTPEQAVAGTVFGQIPPDATIDGWVKRPDKTVKRWRDNAGGTHTAVKIHTPPQIESVGPDDAEWPNLVCRVRALGTALTSSQFELGDLALLVAPMGDPGAHNKSEAKLAQLADEADVPLSTLQGCRYVARAWPPPARARGDEASWSVHRTLMAVPDRVAVLRALMAEHRGHGEGS